MCQNYFKNLLLSEFSCLYLGNWKDDILNEAKKHPQIQVVSEDDALNAVSDLDSKSVICILSDFKSAKYRKQENIDTLYDAAKVSGKRIVILGYRGLGIVSERVE